MNVLCDSSLDGGFSCKAETCHGSRSYVKTDDIRIEIKTHHDETDRAENVLRWRGQTRIEILMFAGSSSSRNSNINSSSSNNNRNSRSSISIIIINSNNIISDNSSSSSSSNKNINSISSTNSTSSNSEYIDLLSQLEMFHATKQQSNFLSIRQTSKHLIQGQICKLLFCSVFQRYSRS